MFAFHCYRFAKKKLSSVRKFQQPLFQTGTAQLLSASALFSISATQPIYAQNETIMDTVVVTGTRSEKTLKDVPVRTEVISKKTIEKQQAMDLKEALQQTPGLYLKKIHGKSGYEVWMQGISSDRVLILIDGQALPSSTGSTIDLTQIGTANIKQIEIVKGATSALYGSSAMGGVINVITEKPKDGETSFSVTGETGSYGKHKVGDTFGAHAFNANYRSATRGYKLSVNGNFRHTDGIDLKPDEFGITTDEGIKTNWDMSIAFPTKSGSYYLAPSYYYEEISRPYLDFNRPPPYPRKLKSELTNRIGLSVGADWELNIDNKFKTAFQHNITDNETSQDGIDNPGTEQERFADIEISELNGQWDSFINDDTLITSGFRLAYETLEVEQCVNDQATCFHEVEPKSKSGIEVFLQTDIFTESNWELLPGIRAQNDSRFGNHIAPKLNALYNIDNNGSISNLRVGYGHGYRAPNLKELFFEFDHSIFGYKVIGNPNLLPEESKSFQLGFEFIQKNNYRLDFNLFHNEVDNLIIEEFNPTESASQGLQIFDYQNVNQARLNGYELSIEIWRKNYTLGFGYTFLKSIDLDTNGPLSKRPEHKGKLTLTLPNLISNGEFIINGNAESESYPDVTTFPDIQSAGFATWDIRYNHTVSKSWIAFFSIENIFDVHRENFNGTDLRPETPRFISIGLTYKDLDF